MGLDGAAQGPALPAPPAFSVTQPPARPPLPMLNKEGDNAGATLKQTKKEKEKAYPSGFILAVVSLTLPQGKMLLLLPSLHMALTVEVEISFNSTRCFSPQYYL